MFRKLVLLVVLFCIFMSPAKAYFDYNANCVKAYQSITSFRLTEARRIINAEKAIHPKNAITILLDNYHDFFYLLATENKNDFDRLINNKSARIDQLENEDENSPYCKFAIAQVNLQWAMLHTRFGNYTSAGFEINKAYRLLQSNSKKFPAFAPNQIPLGVVNVLLGSLPGGPLKSILGFFGIKGSTPAGVKILEDLASRIQKTEFSFEYDELVFYLTYIQADVVLDPLAYSKMCGYVNTIDSASLLKYYIGGYISLRTGHSTEAIAWLQKQPRGAGYQPYPYLDYLMGIAKMNREDADAINYFNRFLQTYTGVNFIKDAYLHIAWKFLLDGDVQRYQAYIKLVATKGNLYHDKDKQAADEANDVAVNATLLQSRLLFDGGFYARAFALLIAKKETDFSIDRDKIEYYYRLGRITDAQDKDDEALKYYQKAISIGASSTYHYAATSAVRIGVIYESRHENANARKYYQMVFNFKNQQFKNSLEQKAREGLSRVGQ